VLLDVVHNHYGPTDLSLWGFDDGNTPGIYFYSASGICCNPWGNRPNYSSEGVRSFIIDNFRMWMDECHIDGFRWDAVGAMRHYDPGYVSIPEADSLIQYINSSVIHAEHPGALAIAEDDSGGMDFDAEWARSYGDTVIATMATPNDGARDMYALQSAISGYGFSRVVYDETHDLVGSLNGSGAQRLPVRINSGDPTGYYARKRSMLGAAIVLCSPGIPMLFMGQEMLATAQFADNAPLDWSRLSTYTNVVSFYRDLIRLRRNLDGVSLGFAGPSISWHAVDNNAKLLAFHRWGAGPNDQVMVVLNCANTTWSHYVVNGFPENGTWYVNLNSDWTRYGSDFGNRGSSMVAVSGGSGDISIGPYSVLILSRNALPNLDADGDGLLNGWEQRYFGDPTSALPDADPDHDGASNFQEQAAGTDPTSVDSVLEFTNIEVAGANLRLTWKGGQSVTQVLQQATALQGPWTSVLTNPAPTLLTNSVAIPASSAGARYFRIQVTR
jgi:1,4-alpha-glucan branching enzyme